MEANPMRANSKDRLLLWICIKTSNAESGKQWVDSNVSDERTLALHSITRKIDQEWLTNPRATPAIPPTSMSYCSPDIE